MIKQLKLRDFSGGRLWPVLRDVRRRDPWPVLSSGCPPGTTSSASSQMTSEVGPSALAPDGAVPSREHEHSAILPLPPTPNLSAHSGWAASASGIPKKSPGGASGRFWIFSSRTCRLTVSRCRFNSTAICQLDTPGAWRAAIDGYWDMLICFAIFVSAEGKPQPTTRKPSRPTGRFWVAADIPRAATRGYVRRLTAGESLSQFRSSPGH